MLWNRFIRTNVSGYGIFHYGSRSFLLAFLVLFSFFPFSLQAAGERSLEKVRLQLKWRHQFQFAGYYAAVEKGYFKEQGLEVELLEGKSDLDPTDSLIRGTAEYAINSPSVLIERQKGLPLVLVAAIFQHSAAVLLTRRDSGLSTPQSFKGKRIMATPVTDPEVMAMFTEEGLAPGSLTVIPHNWGVEDLIDGRIDGQTAYITNEPYLLQQQGVDPLVVMPINYGIDFYGDCLLTTENEVRQYRHRVDAFRQAVIAGWTYAMAHPEELAQLIYSRYSQEKPVSHLLYEAAKLRDLIQPDMVEIGHINRERWKHIGATFAKLNMMPSRYTLNGFFYTDLREQIAIDKQKTANFILIALAIFAVVALLGGIVLVLFNRRLSTLVRLRTSSLAASEQHFRAFFEMASVGVAQVDARTGAYKRVNQKYSDLVGYTIAELELLCFADITYPDDLDIDLEHVQQLLDGKIKEFTIEKRYVHKDGKIVWVFLTVSPLWLPGAEPDYTLAVVRDISARKKVEENLAYATRVFANSIEGIVVTDAQGTILQVNPAFTAITGYSREEALGQNPRILKSDKHPPEYYEDMWHQLTMTGQWAGEIWNRRKNGEAYSEWLTISAVHDNYGKITNYVSIFHDISELKKQQEALEHQAQHDALTGLPNRVLIKDRLEMALYRITRYEGKIALLYFDLDNFKHINDAFGHTEGDNLLIEVARRLTALLRTGDTMARLGGDEFLILLTEIEQIDTVSLIAHRLVDSLQMPFHHGEYEFFMTASIGITVAPDDGQDAVTLVKNADIAMYRAKALGRNNYQFFAPDLDVQAHQRVAMETRLRKALEKQEFELYYQPLVGLSDGHIYGAEALIRWWYKGKLIAPGDFIPLAEESGLILPLGEWVIQEAVRHTKMFEDNGYRLGISVNISFRQFSGQDLLAVWQDALYKTNLRPGCMYFECTESMVMGNLANAQRIMGGLRELGVKFYLDDFGTGYSSLSHLKRLPIDGFKIDRSFIRDIAVDTNSMAIAQAILSLAETLGLDVVAEGVETEEQRQQLLAMGGGSKVLLQGYLASPPLPVHEFVSLLEKGNFTW